MANYKSVDPEELARLQQGVAVLADIPPLAPSIRLAKAVSEALLRVPAMYAGWGDQLHRAAVSVPANICEAAGRNSLAQRLQYTSIGRGSAFEVLGLLLAAPVGQDVTGLVDQARDVAKLLDALVLEMTEKKSSSE